jgi:sarcosine oxidase
MAQTRSFDVAVVGLGAMGSAALYQLAKRGISAVGIDQFAPPHTQGSTHGDTRVTRLATGEGLHYVPLVQRSHALWRQIEEETGTALLTQNGGLIIASNENLAIKHGAKFFENTLLAAKTFGIAHELLDATEIRRRFPPFQVRESEIGYYEKDAGILKPEACVRAQLALATRQGALVRTDERILSLEATPGGVTLSSDRARYAVGHVLLTAGPWLAHFLPPELARLFEVTRQVLYWFEVPGPIAPYEPERFPIFIWALPGLEKGLYGFPALDGPAGGLKIATEQYQTTTTPETVDRTVSAREQNEMYRSYVAPFISGLGARCLKAVTCLYTLSQDGGFVIDRHPVSKRVTIVSPCSGHGFKHSAALGEALAERIVEGKSRIDLSPFTLSRFGAEHDVPRLGAGSDRR